MKNNPPLFPGAPQNNQQNQGQTAVPNVGQHQPVSQTPAQTPVTQNQQKPNPTQANQNFQTKIQPVQQPKSTSASVNISKKMHQWKMWGWILGAVVVVVAIVLLVIFLPKRGTAPGDTNGNGGTPVTEVTSGPFNSELKYGMDGSPEIALLQTFLIGQKYLNGAPNGDFYTYTRDAVEKFQKAQGLQVTGIVNESTRDLLNRFYAVAPGYFTDDESLSGIGTGQCKAFAVTSPTAGANVVFPLKVSGIVHPKYNTGRWTVFEANAGSVVVKDVAGNSLSNTVPLSLSGEWMNTDPKPFSVTIPALTTSIAKDTLVDIVFTDDNPAGDEGTQHSCVLTVRML